MQYKDGFNSMSIIDDRSSIPWKMLSDLLRKKPVPSTSIMRTRSVFIWMQGPIYIFVYLHEKPLRS